MIKAKHIWLYHIFFRNYFRYILWKDFRKVEIYGDYRDNKLPILIISNHASWWDGFFAYELNRKIFMRRFHLMMLQEQLAKHAFFRNIGAFSIAPGNRTALESLSYASKILDNNSNMLILFPQGQLESQYTSPLEFHQGWFRILKGRENHVKIIFTANLTDYFSYRKPALFIYFEEYQKTSGFTLEELHASYNEFYQRCLIRQTKLS